MKKFLILGIVFLMTGVALIQGVLSLQDKTIDSEEFALGTEESFIKITDPSLEIFERDGKRFNNEANIYVHNNATYDGLTFEVSADTLNGFYPSNVAIDIGDNGRDEYRFTGPGVGQWGNQSYMFDQRMKNDKSHEVFPTTDGVYTYVKLPSRATVNDITFDVAHPLVPTYQEAKFTSQNTIEVANARSYSYNYDYDTGTDRWYGYSYYYPKSYMDYTSSYFVGNYYPGYTRSYSSYDYTYRYAHNRGYLAWDLEHPDFSIPPGATILQYDLNFPIRRYHYRAYYGYDWISNPPGSYYSGEQYWGAFAVTSEHPDEYTYSYTNYDYDYQRQDPYLDGYYDYLDDYLPANRTDPEDYVHFQEHWYSTSYQNLYNINFDLKGLYDDWVSGNVDNHGVMLERYKTPYSDAPHLESNAYVLYNDAGSYSSPWQKDCSYFYYNGYTYNPLYTRTSSYLKYHPKLVIGYDLASTDLNIDIGNDGTAEFSQAGNLEGKVSVGGTPAFTNSVNSYLQGHLPDEVDVYGNEFTYVPIKWDASSAGLVKIDNIHVEYDYSARVDFNPTTGSAVNELNSLVSSNEDGWELIEINITSNTDGVLNFDNLELTGQKPNYRPTVDEIILPKVKEGVVEPTWIEISQFFHDVDQDPTTLEYWVESNSASDHVDLMITETDTRAGPVYLGIDTSKDENWNGDMTVVIGAMDDGGKDVYTDPFTITVEPVNDMPHQVMELPEIEGEEGIDPILIEYTAPTGRDVATGKISMLLSGDGDPYFADVEEQDIHLGFRLLDSEMNETYLETSNDEGFKIYRTGGDVTLTILPPEYTDDPDNYIVLISSNPDYNYESGLYYLRIFTSDNPYDIYGQTYHTLPIMIMPSNDAPKISDIPDIVLDEDSTYTGTVDFISEYISDIDSEMEDITVTFEPSTDRMEVYLDSGNYLHVDPEMNFYGVVPVTITADDGKETSVSTFTVGVRSINDPPKVIVNNLFDGRIINDMFYIRGSANDIEKSLRWVEIGIVEKDGFLYEDDWEIAEGAYVWQYLLDIRDLETGDYDVFIRAYDGRDYSETLEFTIRVESVIDTGTLSPPPLVQITSLMEGQLKDRVEVEGTVTDDSGYVDFVEYRIDGGLWRRATITDETWMAVINTRTLTNDNHNLSVRAYDGKSYSDVVFKQFEVMNADSDLDGITNEMEEVLQLDPFNPVDGTMDFDEDGFSNAEEVEANTDIFDGSSHPEISDDEAMMDSWALIFIAVALVSAVIIIALFILNIRIEKNMHQWREDLHGKRVERKPKTLLQKIVDLTPNFAGREPPSGPALPGSFGSEGSDAEALPPAKESGPEN